MDAVEYYLGQWRAVKPDLDVEAFATIGRLSRLAVLMQARLDAVFAEYGLQSWEFDSMAALRRSGEPFELTPGQLDRRMLISSGTTTHRISKLEERGFVTRRRDTEDRRVVRVRLTDAGIAVFDAAHVAHARNERLILDAMSAGDQYMLLRGLTALAEAVGDRPPADA